MFSFDKGRQIGYIDNGDIKDRKILRIDSDAKETSIKANKSTFLDSDFFKDIKGPSRKKSLDKNLLLKALDRDVEPLELELLHMFNKAKKHVEKHLGKVYKCNADEKIVPIIDDELERMALYIGGPSGAGKSRFTGNWCESYKKFFPKNQIYLISRNEKPEKAFKNLDVKQISVDSEFISDPIEPYELSNSMVIFDDCDTFATKEQQNAVDSLKDALLETGRKLKISLCVISHLLTDYSRSKKVLNECNAIVCFPQGGSAHQIKYCLNHYFGLASEDIKKIQKLPSRWVMILKNYPQTVIYETGCYILSNDNV